MREEHSRGMQMEGKELAARVERIFPATTYAAPPQMLQAEVDPDDPSDLEDLAKFLHLKTWKDLDQTFLEANPDEYLIMDGPMVQAFLPAWIRKAAAEIETYGDTLQFMMWSLARIPPPVDYLGEEWVDALTRMNEEQRAIVREILTRSSVVAEDVGDTVYLTEALRKLDLYYSAYPPGTLIAASTAAHRPISPL